MGTFLSDMVWYAQQIPTNKHQETQDVQIETWGSSSKSQKASIGTRGYCNTKTQMRTMGLAYLPTFDWFIMVFM